MAGEFKFYQNSVECFFTVECVIGDKTIRYVDQEGAPSRFTYRQLSATGAVGQQALEALANRLSQLEAGHTRAGD